MSEISKPMLKKVKIITDTLGIEYTGGDSYAKMREFILQYYDEAMEVNQIKEEFNPFEY